MEIDEERRGKKEAAALSGGHLCHVCGYQYPNPHPSAKLRRSHRKHCGKAPPAAAAPAVEEEGEAVAGMGVAEREERNAGEDTLLGGEGGGGGDGRGASGANGSSALCGSAREVDDSVEVKEIAEHASPNGAGAQHIANEFSENGLIDCINSEKVSLDDTGAQVITSEFSENGLLDCTSSSIEIVNEGNGTELLVACTNGSQNKVAKHCSGIASITAGHPAEREDSFDEYQDASPFLHQSDSEDVAAPNSELSLENNNLNTVSSGSSVAANEISLEKYGSCQDQFSSEPNMTDLCADSIVGYTLENGTPRFSRPEVSLKPGGPYECTVNVDSNSTHKVATKSDKTSSHSELIGDSNASSFQETHPLISEPESQSTCSGKVEGCMEDRMHVLHTMSEASPRPVVVGSDNVQLETITGTMPIGNELKVIYTDNTPTDCSVELPTQDRTFEDTPDVHLPVENSCQESSVCSADGFQNDLLVTNVDDMPNSIAEDSCNELNFTFEDRSQPRIVEKIVNTAEENPSVTHGFTKGEVCSNQIDPEVPTEDQFSTSQKHADEVSSVENPFDLDDARNDDLCELPTDSCLLEVTNVVELRQQDVSTSLSVSNQAKMYEAQHSHNSNDCILSASSASQNGQAIGPENVPDSSSAVLAKNDCLTDVLDHGLHEDEVRTSGVTFESSEVASMEFSTVSTPDLSTVSTIVEENMQTEDSTGKDITAVHSTDNIEMKQGDGATAKDTYAANVEEKKLTEAAAAMNEVQHTDQVEEKKQAGGTMEASAVKGMGNPEENKQNEATNANEMNARFNTDNNEEKRQADDTNAKTTNTIGLADNFEEKMLAQDTTAKEKMVAAQRTGSVEDTKDPNGTVGQEGNNQNEEIDVTGARLNSGRVHVPLKVLLAEASVENKVVRKPSAKERVLSFRRRVSKDDNSSAKSGGSPKAGADDLYWNSPARLPRKDVDKRSKARKQPWMPFICCHSVH